MHSFLRYLVTASLLGVLAGQGSAGAVDPLEPLVFGHAADPGDVVPVSLVYLLANPTALNGKRVRVTGILRFQFEGDGIFLDTQSYRYAIHENGIGLDLGPDEERLKLYRDKEKDFSSRVVIVEGVFFGEPPQAPCKGRHGCIVARRGFDSYISAINLLEVQPNYDAL